MSKKEKINCPKCGNKMNHHADKITYPTSAGEMEYFDQAYEGILEEHHKCPACGFTVNLKVKEEKL